MAKTHDPAIKAAVLAALLDGQGVTEVARQYDLPKGTVGNWKREAQQLGTIPNEKRDRIGDLLIANLEGHLEATHHITATLLRNQDWLERQSAADIAVLFGVVTDKQVRLLEAAHSGDDDGPAAE